MFQVSFVFNAKILASQLAALDEPELDTWLDFLYMRKTRKTTGTCQQLEGLQKFTDRTPDSPPLVGIWIDDVMSTGTSLLDGMNTLKVSHWEFQVDFFRMTTTSSSKQPYFWLTELLTGPNFYTTMPNKSWRTPISGKYYFSREAITT